MMDTSTKRKTYWITGASSGIGKAFAVEASLRGHQLILSSRSEGTLKQVREECAYPERVIVLPLDLSQSDELPEKVPMAIGMAGGRIDVMVHCGGISQRSLVTETDLSVDRKVMEIDFFGTVALTKALLPHFIENQAGQFAVVTSLMGKFSSPKRSGYCAAKHALHGFFNALRAEHTEDNVKVTMICPGFVRTNISRNALVGDGSAQETMDEATNHGISPTKCAKKMYKAIQKEKAEVYIGGKEVLGVYVHRFFPALLRRMLPKAKVT